MNKKRGLSRPGALQMILAAALMLGASIGPVIIAFVVPSHQWLMVLNGLPAVALSLAGIAIVVLYFVGFIRYCADKGYSKWLGVWLLLGNVFGFICLLLLPDLTSTKQKMENIQITQVPGKT